MEATAKKPSLKRLAEFREALTDYRPSDESLRMLRGTRVSMLTGPTSSGRNAVIRELQKTGEYHYLVSDTTRPPRVNDGVLEQDGVEYWFKTEEEVLEGIRDGKYIEAEIIHKQQVSGTNITELEIAFRKNQICTSEVDIGGIAKFHDYKPDTVCIMLLPPEFDEWMRRLEHRGRLDDAELRRRLKTALTVIATGMENDYFHFIINRDLATCVQTVHDLSIGGLPDLDDQQWARAHAEQLAVDVQLFLNQ